MLDQTRAVKEKINWNNPNEVSSYEKNVSGRFEHVKFLATKHEDDFNQLIEIESDIKALAIEASHYFAIHNSKQLNKTIVEGFEADSLLATDYRSMSYQELERYYLNGFREAVTKKKESVDERRMQTITMVAEILR